jgi:hypothetical protein
MLNQNESHAGMGWNPAQKLAAGVEPSGGRADRNNGKRDSSGWAGNGGKGLFADWRRNLLHAKSFREVRLRIPGQLSYIPQGATRAFDFSRDGSD